MHEFMTGPSKTRAGPAIAAVLLFNPMLGSFYAWSVFLAPLEAELGVPRSEISTVFGEAIFGLTERRNMLHTLASQRTPADAAQELVAMLGGDRERIRAAVAEALARL